MENLAWGFQMTVLGMGLVFTLLAILWALLKLVLVLDKGDEEEAPLATPQAPAEAAQSAVAEEAQAPAIPTVNGMAADLVAAITIAVMRHKMTLRGEAAPTLFSELDACLTSMGSRLLRHWLHHPRRDRDLLNQRLAAIRELIDAPQAGRGARDLLNFRRNVPL